MDEEAYFMELYNSNEGWSYTNFDQHLYVDIVDEMCLWLQNQPPWGEIIPEFYINLPMDQ